MRRFMVKKSTYQWGMPGLIDEFSPFPGGVRRFLQNDSLTDFGPVFPFMLGPGEFESAVVVG